MGVLVNQWCFESHKRGSLVFSGVNVLHEFKFAFLYFICLPFLFNAYSLYMITIMYKYYNYIIAFFVVFLDVIIEYFSQGVF